MVKPKYEFDPKGTLERALKDANKKVQDLTIPYKLMTGEWFKSNRAIFSLKGPGQYEDLSPKYKKIKERYLGSAYPILRGFLKPKGQPAKVSGKLERSLTKPGDANSVSFVLNKKILVLGTKAKSKKNHLYPASLHHGTNKMPARPVVLSGAEQVQEKRTDLRNKLWAKMLRKYVVDVSKFASKK